MEEEPNKTWNDQEKRKKLPIKIGAGGIGAVVLVGGVLATAAFASAFVFRRKGRSSGKDRRRRRQQSPPQSEQDEASKGAAKEVSTESLKLDGKGRVGINGNVEGSDEILSSISPKKLEKDAFTDDGFIVLEEEPPMLEEKSFPECPDKMSEDEKTNVQSTSDYCSNENKYVERVDNAFEAIEIDRTEGEKGENVELKMEKDVEGLCSNNGKISGEKCVEAMGGDVDLGEDCGNQEAIGEIDSLSETYSEDGRKTLQPVFENLVIERGKVDGHEKEDDLPVRTVEMIREDPVDSIMEILIEERGKCDHTDDEVVSEKCGEVECTDEAKQNNQEKEENDFIPYENDEERDCITYPMIGERISEVTHVTNEKVAESQVLYKNKTSALVDDEKYIEKKVDENVITKDDIINEEEDEAKNSIHDEAVRPAESPQFQQAKLINHEVEGKIVEDKPIKQGEETNPKIIEESSFKPHRSISDEDSSDSEQAFIKKCVAEMGVMKDQPTNSIKWRIIIALIAVVAVMLMVLSAYLS